MFWPCRSFSCKICVHRHSKLTGLCATRGTPTIREGTGVVGVVTVSGVPQREDHGFVVEMLCHFLGVEHAMLELGPENN